MAAPAEIIDLTSPKAEAHEIIDSELEQADPTAITERKSRRSDGHSLIPSEATPDEIPKTHKKKTRRSKRSSLHPSPTTPNGRESPRSTAPDAEPTPGTRTKRKRRDESPHDSAAGPLSRRARREAERQAAKQTEPEDIPLDELFRVDLQPDPITFPVTATNSTQTADTETSTKLLVPSHVTVLGSTPVEIIQPLSENEQDEDFINYLDYDDSRHMLRYYDEPVDKAAVMNRTVCKNCGAEGDHKTSACTVMICLTCGLRNEHSTRSCPISKVCFTCGMKGHINANCPNRRSARAFQSSREVECDRCYSSRHKTNECPTVWRLYEYYSTEEQTSILELRRSKKDLKLTEGGEGYVADDEWCYFCGHCGHWGDDCRDMDEAPEEHSAFSLYNVMLGPFYDPDNQRKPHTSRSHRDWSSIEDTSWAKNAPGPVGRQGRMKSRAALEKQAQQTEDDPDDWFASKRSNTSNRGQQKEGSKTFTFGKGMGSGKQYAPPPADSGRPSLLARLDQGRSDGRDARSGHRSYKRDSRDDSSGGHRDRRRREEKSSNHHSDRRKHEPRYRGGYVAR